MTAEITEKVTSRIKQKIKEAGWSVVKTAALSAAITAGVSSAFPAIGFTNGIVAGSIMSIYQQNYNISKQYFSPFSLVKKAGVKSLVVVTKVGITAATVATTGIYGACKTLWNKSKKKENMIEISDELKKDSNIDENEEVNESNAAQIDTDWVNIRCSEEQTLVITS